jgi:hypothetical protein
MTSLLTHRIHILVALSNCPACGKPVVSGGGGVAFAISTFACGSEFVIANDEIAVSRPCPSGSHVAALHLNQLAAAAAAEAGVA